MRAQHKDDQGLPPSNEPRSDGVDQLLEAQRSELQQRFPMPPPRPPRRRAIQAGASSLAVAALAAGLWWADPCWKTETIANAPGAPRSVALADGSRLTLDAKTRLELRWHLRSRRVELQQGRASFDVAHSGWRPFVVEAGPASIQVLGTAFEVDRADEQTVEVALWRGCIQLSERGRAVQPLRMRPGERLRMSRQGGHAVLQPLPTVAQQAPGWTAGQLVFHRTPLREVVRELQRYREGPILIEGEGLAELQLSGVFESKGTEQLLALLPRILPVRLVRGASGELRIRPL